MEDDIATGKWVSQGDAGYVFASQVPNSVPFYRLYSSTETDHYYTTDETDRDNFVAAGYTFQRIDGYVYPTALCGSVPLYKVYNAAAPDHLYTTNITERDVAIDTQNYVDEGVAAYIFPPQ